MPPKRKQNTSATASASKKQKPKAIHEWRVVLTGEFQRKDNLEIALKEKGAAVTGSISGKTTHLILGETGRNDYGKVTGLGSKKHTEAVQRGIPILTEADVYAILAGDGTEAVEAAATERDAPKPKPAKSAPLLEKICYVLHCQGVGKKLSLPKMKSLLSSEYGLDFSKTATKTSLKKALQKGVEETKKITMFGASYTLTGMAAAASGPVPEAVVEAEQKASEKRNERWEARIAPRNGRWRRLRVVSQQVSKSGRAKCKACGQPIMKGYKQVEVMDDSLFKMCVFPGDCHEGVSRGYVEAGIPGYDVVSRKKFKVHEECVDDAEEQFKATFQRDWSNIRPHVMEMSGIGDP